ncbi:MAG: PEGA domain-containing protein [Vicinamibacterales bacterium]|jgi:hypothetical protein|nr:PEGA domain-containing protein [Vicinamibacterales bacterium]MDP7693216.1 PEGA domain-containing protein [Vicinamibacterales bacterium]HJN45429.1 PEGA domain-containing protein [Vicinamibacterales bacterium]|tara:strand:- start:2122 stop:2913 length:792 start_codon:yes stop_codon:yes gene_type:complete
MSLLEHQSEEEAPSRTGRVVLIGLIVIGCGVAAYFYMAPVEDAAPVTTAADPPAATPRPAPEPTREAVPDPEAPPPVREPEPEVVAEAPPPAAALEPILRVASDVPGASVFLDRTYLGTTPFEIAEVALGPHRLNVSAEGYEGIVRDIEIGDELVSVDIRFLVVRLDASVPVEHKHRFGSCTGVLRADLDGIHYDTPDDDAFSIPLDEIERHEIDYLEHTLTLQHREGRTYNFTDDQDTADALFVFHRDVEQARERLSASEPQ